MPSLENDFLRPLFVFSFSLNKELLVIIIIIFDHAGLSLYPYSSVLNAATFLPELHTAQHPFVAEMRDRTAKLI